MRSVVVVLPASICAIMPIFRIRSNGISRGMVLTLLELSVVRKCTIGLGHALYIFLAFDRSAGVVVGIHDLGGQALVHGFAGATASRHQQPAHRQRLAAVALDLDRHLVGRAADALGLDLDSRAGVANS